MELKISFFDFGVDYVASREKLRQNTFAKWSISFRLGEDNKVKFPWSKIFIKKDPNFNLFTAYFTHNLLYNSMEWGKLELYMYFLFDWNFFDVWLKFLKKVWFYANCVLVPILSTLRDLLHEDSKRLVKLVLEETLGTA